METLSLREMLWLEHRSAWTDAGLRMDGLEDPRPEPPGTPDNARVGADTLF